MPDHAQLTIDGRQETITAPLVGSLQPVAEPLFTSAPAPRGSLAFTWDDDAPLHEPMRSARCRRMR